MSNLTLSLELISFINWLLENRQEEVRELITQSVELEDLKLSHCSEQNSNWAHEVIEKFVRFLETGIKESMEKSDLLEAKLREQLSELADDMNLSMFDDSAILRGFRQAKNQIERIEIDEEDYALNKKLFKRVLMQRILDNWEPSNRAAQA